MYLVDMMSLRTRSLPRKQAEPISTCVTAPRGTLGTRFLTGKQEETYLKLVSGTLSARTSEITFAAPSSACQIWKTAPCLWHCCPRVHASTRDAANLCAMCQMMWMLPASTWVRPLHRQKCEPCAIRGPWGAVKRMSCVLADKSSAWEREYLAHRAVGPDDVYTHC